MSDTEIDDLEFSVRTSNCLKANGVFTLQALRELTWGVAGKWRGFGRKSWWEIREVLESLDHSAKRYELQQTENAFVAWCLLHRQSLELVRAKKAVVVVDFRGAVYEEQPE